MNESSAGHKCRGHREELPDERRGVTHKFTITGHDQLGNVKDYDVYLNVGLYGDGKVGEIFVHMGRTGGREGALLDSWAKAVSLLLQYGCSLEDVVAAFRGTGFEPAGFVDGHEQIKSCKSPIDYIVRWLELRFLGGDDEGDDEDDAE